MSKETASAALEQLSRNELLLRARELERDLHALQRERDDLRRQNDDYIRNGTAATFDMSSLLLERALSAESQLQHLKQTHERCVAERDGLKEDVAHIKEAKRLSDKATREATSSVTKMAEQLEFYQRQAMDAMQARDKANGEVEKLKTRTAKLDSLCSSSQAALKAEERSHDETKQLLTGREGEIEELKKRTEQASQVPTLRLQLDQREEALENAIAAREASEAKLAQIEKELEVRAEAVEGLRQQAAAAADEQAALQARITELQGSETDLRARIQDGEAKGEAAQKAAVAELDAARTQIHKLQEELDAANESVADLSSKVHEVAEEKLRLLMDNAALEQQVRDGNLQEREEEDDAWGGWPWKTSPRVRVTASRQSSPSKTAASSPGASKDQGTPSSSAGKS